MTLWILTLAIAYLLGSIPFGYLLVRFFRQEDVRDTGSGNIGATNVARAGGKGLGIFTLSSTPQRLHRRLPRPCTSPPTPPRLPPPSPSPPP